jgi:hypothetical protein
MKLNPVSPLQRFRIELDSEVVDSYDHYVDAYEVAKAYQRYGAPNVRIIDSLKNPNTQKGKK